MTDKKEIRKSLASDYKQLAELQEEIAGKEDLLDTTSTYRPQNGFSPIYADKFQKVIESLSKAEITVMWEVKKCFDKHHASKSHKTEVPITTISIHSALIAMNVEMSPDTVRKSLRKLINISVIKPLSASSKGGNRSMYRLNPFIVAGTFSENLGKLQEEWNKLFPEG